MSVFRSRLASRNRTSWTLGNAQNETAGVAGRSLFSASPTALLVSRGRCACGWLRSTGGSGCGAAGRGSVAPSRGRRRFGLGQRDRIIRQRIEERDHVRALLVVVDAREGHRRSRNEVARRLQELIQVVEGPLAAFGLHRLREIEAPAVLAALVAHDIPQVR